MLGFEGNERVLPLAAAKTGLSGKEKICRHPAPVHNSMSAAFADRIDDLRHLLLPPREQLGNCDRGRGRKNLIRLETFSGKVGVRKA